MSASVSTVADGHKTKIPAKMEEPLTKLLKKKEKCPVRRGNKLK